MSEAGRENGARLDLAARAAWLYYVNGETQDAIARRLALSRPAVQRLVALAVAERLVTIRLEHPVASCMQLAGTLARRYDLEFCDVAPAEGPRSVALLAAARLERALEAPGMSILAVGSGRQVRATVAELTPTPRPELHVVGLVGSIARDGAANPFEVVMRLADRLGAASYPMPSPAVVDSAEERELWQAQRPWRAVAELADRASLAVIGVGHIARGAPLEADGFVRDDEMAALGRAGAVGEIFGWAFDVRGHVLDHVHNTRVTALPIPRPGTTMVLAAGAAKVTALRGALEGRLVNAMVTDEATATATLDGATA